MSGVKNCKENVLVSRALFDSVLKLKTKISLPHCLELMEDDQMIFFQLPKIPLAENVYNSGDIFGKKSFLIGLFLVKYSNDREKKEKRLALDMIKFTYHKNNTQGVFWSDAIDKYVAGNDRIMIFPIINNENSYKDNTIECQLSTNYFIFNESVNKLLCDLDNKPEISFDDISNQSHEFNFMAPGKPGRKSKY